MNNAKTLMFLDELYMNEAMWLYWWMKDELVLCALEQGYLVPEKFNDDNEYWCSACLEEGTQ